MSVETNQKTNASMVVEYIRLPDVIEPGRYDAYGRPDPDGNLFLGLGSGIVHMWGVFKGGLQPGQIGSMTFTNVFGSYALTGNFSEWLPGPTGYSPHAVMHKRMGDPLGEVPPRPREIPPGTKPQDIEAGDWINQVHVFDKGPDQPPEIVIGSEANIIMRNVNGDVWIIHKYNAIFQGLQFEQHGIWGYDPNDDHYHATWVKTVQSNLAVYEGSYDERTHKLFFEGETRSCFGDKDPKTGKVYKVKERRIITYQDMDSKTLDVFQEERPGGRFVQRDQVISKRRPALAGGNVPYIGDTPMNLIALQRGLHVVKVVGQNTSQSHRNAAAGMVMLGPQWNGIFGNAMRL